MGNTWVQRALARAKVLGISITDLNRSVGKTSTTMTDAVGPKQSVPSVDNFAKIAKRLGMTVGELYDGDKPVPEKLQVTGYLRGGEMWHALARNEKREVPLSFFDRDLVVIEVASNELSPTYRLGDLLVGTKTLGRNLDNLIGRDCIVETIDGQRYVKYLARGRTATSWALRSFNPSEPDLDGLKLAWAAPIEMVVRAGG